MIVDVLLLQLLLVVWLGPSAVVAHPGGPPGFPGCLYKSKRNPV
jgi:hypothetical protein